MIILIFIHLIIESNSICLKNQNYFLSIIRGNYKNVLQKNGEAIISSRLQNGMKAGKDGSCLNDSMYDLDIYTWNYHGQSIAFQLRQVYELNTLKIWFWDGDSRIYRFKIYIQNENQEKLVYDGTGKSIFILKFPDLFVSRFRLQSIISFFFKIILSIVNVSGNTFNNQMHLLRAEAYYN
ncbi:unnamed protein product (macronuclear) [Paramecium tetraurelia]|uniref:NADH:ubiquinone oxidoreductase intermediate-associated protein 30 domain-containing protein n=1 Tax=Paramecium tetraurelia TaxID=5888 RepID=A0BDR4_PARTE|nr:uncharacterized protein GSPATT00027711001 [Paramecium tetraurelia]CAK56681.1 unnamed protein product [Paramecium tetraurelia]|eukprot:XP_001424079.1 hypothetical protein (macronuclear) [Paramecium tetraurelia strain d4-2]